MIEASVIEIRHSLPPGVLLVAAAKTRLPREVRAAMHAGIKIVGYNYVQEAVDKLIMQIHDLPNLRIQGLMTMGPRFGNALSFHGYE